MIASLLFLDPVSSFLSLQCLWQSCCMSENITMIPSYSPHVAPHVLSGRAVETRPSRSIMFLLSSLSPGCANTLRHNVMWYSDTALCHQQHHPHPPQCHHPQRAVRPRQSLDGVGGGTAGRSLRCGIPNYDRSKHHEFILYLSEIWDTKSHIFW